MARPKNQVAKGDVVDKVERHQDRKSPLRIAENGGKFILYHGGSVRQVFMTRAKAEEYLEWCKG